MERDDFMLVFTLMFDGTITSSMCVRKSCGLLDTRKAMYIIVHGLRMISTPGLNLN